MSLRHALTLALLPLLFTAPRALSQEPLPGPSGGTGPGAAPEATQDLENRVSALRTALRDLRAEEQRLSRELRDLERRLGGGRLRRSSDDEEAAPDAAPAPRRRPTFSFGDHDRGFGDLRESLGDLDRWFESRGDLMERLEELQKRFQGGAGVAPFPGLRFQFGNGMQGQSRGIKVEQTPDGVRVEVTEQDENGDTSTRTYEGESWEDIVAEHPELRDSMGAGGFRFETRPNGRFGAGPGRGTAPAAPLPAAPRRLGCMVAPVGPETAEASGLGAVAGLVVVEVEAGSLAERLGLLVDDVILSIDGQKIEDVSGVRRALGAASDRIRVKVHRPGAGELQLDAKADSERPVRPLKRA